jgi:dihydropteroate synthase
VDTFRSEVAYQSIEAGASIINDISAGRLDEKILEVAGKLQVPYMMMHMRGNAQTMNSLTQYENLIKEIIDYFHMRISLARSKGIKDIIIDPGFGFAKTVDQNFELLKSLKQLQILEKPILVGLSRKSMIWRTLQVTPEEALNGSTVVHTLALINGAGILRAHDVKQARETVKLLESYLAFTDPVKG